MSTINEITNLLMSLSVAGAIMRLAYCMVRMMFSEDGAGYKKRAVNAVIYAVIAVSVAGIKEVITYYFS